MAEVSARKRRMAEGLVAMHIDKYKESGAELVFGEGSFVGPKTIQVRLNNGGGAWKPRRPASGRVRRQPSVHPCL